MASLPALSFCAQVFYISLICRELCYSIGISRQARLTAMQKLLDSYIATLRKAVAGEPVAPDTVLSAYKKVTDYLFTSPSGERAIPSEKFWNSEMGQLLARTRILAGDLLTISEFHRESGMPISTISYWAKLGKLESIIDPDQLSRSPQGGCRRLIPRSELDKI